MFWFRSGPRISWCFQLAVVYCLLVVPAQLLQVRICDLSYLHVKQSIWIPARWFPCLTPVSSMFCLGLWKVLWLQHLDFHHVLDTAPLGHSSTVIRISVCNSLFVLQSEFLLLGFLLFQNCNPSGHLMKHKSNSSAGELSLDFAVCGGQLNFWSWMKIHVTLAHLNLSLRFIWLEVMCLSEGKKNRHQCLQYGSWECGTSCKVAV